MNDSETNTSHEKALPPRTFNSISARYRWIRFNYNSITMSNYPAGAANDSRAPYNQTEIKPTKVDVIVYESATQFNGDVQNFVVHEVNAEPGFPWGCGSTLAKAIEDFEETYSNRHDEPCEAVIVETKIQD